MRGLARIDSSTLQAELRRRQRGIARLSRRRDRLLAEATRLDREIALLGGTSNGRAGPARRGRRRAKNALTLVEGLAKVLKGKTMSVTDASDAVRRAGYRTASKTFRTQVNIALIKSGRFRRVDRGRYTAK